MKKVLSAIGNVILALFFIIAVCITALSVTSVFSEDRVPNFLGYAVMTVQTDSMQTETGFDVGDVIIVRMVDEEEANALKVGDVITFRRFNTNHEMYLDTHRIVENTYEVTTQNQREIVDGIRIHNGIACYVTRGDNEEMPDVYPNGELEYATYENIVGIWEGTKIPVLGKILDFLRSQVGFFVCILLPLLAFFIWQLIRFITILNQKRKEDALQAVSESEEEIKKKAVEEYLARQAAQTADNKEEDTQKTD